MPASPAPAALRRDPQSPAPYQRLPERTQRSVDIPPPAPATPPVNRQLTYESPAPVRPVYQPSNLSRPPQWTPDNRASTYDTPVTVPRVENAWTPDFAATPAAIGTVTGGRAPAVWEDGWQSPFKARPQAPDASSVSLFLRSRTSI